MPTDIPADQADIDNAGIEEVESRIVKAMHEHWRLYLGEGACLLILGLIAVAVPPLTTLAVANLFGWLFVVSGAIGLFTTFWMRGVPGFRWSLASAVLAILAAIWLLARPIAGPLTLTAVLILFFLIEGISSVMFAIDHRRELSGHWEFMLLSGLVDLVLCVMLASGLPSTAIWALGLLVGVNMVFGGVALIAMALHARSEAQGLLAAWTLREPRS
jgi:uncharacterized membrane protein HdeD (DUF308 family)